MRNFSDWWSLPVTTCMFGPARAGIPHSRHQILGWGLSGAGVRPPHAFQGGGLLLGGGEVREISGNTKPSGSRPFQNLSVLSLPSWCLEKHVAHRRCSLHVCSSREGAPRGHLGNRPSANLVCALFYVPRNQQKQGQSKVPIVVPVVDSLPNCYGSPLSRPQF